MADMIRHVIVASEGATYLNRVTDDHGHEILADEPLDKGGTGQGLTPFELVGAGLGACTSITLMMYAKSRKIDLRDVTVDVRYFRAGEAGHAADFIERKIALVGALDAATVTKLGAIAKRCPVHLMLEKAVQIEDTISHRQ